jgi:hypothetical protein
VVTRSARYRDADGQDRSATIRDPRPGSRLHRTLDLRRRRMDASGRRRAAGCGPQAVGWAFVRHVEAQPDVTGKNVQSAPKRCGVHARGISMDRSPSIRYGIPRRRPARRGAENLFVSAGYRPLCKFPLQRHEHEDAPESRQGRTSVTTRRVALCTTHRRDSAGQRTASGYDRAAA